MHRRKLAVLALLPALLSGCGALGLSSSTGAGPGSSSGSSGPASGSNWIVTAQGSATPSAGPSYPVIPTPSPIGGFLPLGPVNPVRTPVLTCSPNQFQFSKVHAATAVTSGTSAVVSWYNIGGTNLVQFRITAISQDLVGGRQRDIGFTVVPPKQPCGDMTATVTGLDRKTGYVFSVDAVVTRKSGDGTHAATVARTGVLRTT
jgi:hypothetical protein